MATSLSTTGPPSNTIPWAHSSPQPKRHLDRFSCYRTGTADCPYTLQWGTPFAPQNRPFPWGIWTPSNTWFTGLTRVLNPNGISIGAAVFAGLTNVTDRQTDRPCYSVGNNRPHLRTQYCDAAQKIPSRETC